MVAPVSGRLSLDVRHHVNSAGSALKGLGTVFIVTVVGGFTTFLFAGGLPGLASDVGLSGALYVLLFVQILYAVVFSVGFLIAQLILIRWSKSVLMVTETSIGTLLMTVFVNLLGIYHTGKPVEFWLIATTYAFGSMSVYLGLPWLRNSLTNGICGRA